MKAIPLEKLITDKHLQDLAGERSYDRGCAYFESGAVERLTVRNNRITARVAGSDLYTVKLWPEGRELEWDCTCPMGEDGAFCKHAVATGLAWLQRHEDGSSGETDAHLETLRQSLEARDKSELVEIILERAAEDEEFAAALLVDAQQHGDTDPASVRQLIRDTLPPRGFIDYRHMRTFAMRARPIPDLLRGLLRGKDADSVLELAAGAAHRGLRSLQNVDDSDGMLGDIVREVAEIVVEAARKAHAKPEVLAKTLFDLQRADGFGFFSLEDWLPLLGKMGLAAYRQFATRAWKKIPALGPGDDKLAGRDDGRYELSEIMQALAELDGDTDVLVDVLRRDLTGPWNYLKIAELLAAAKRHDEALKWAEDGRAAFAGQPMAPLDDFLVAAYQRAKRHDDAIALRWSRFETDPSLPNYQKLNAAADKIKQWPTWRDKALSWLYREKAAVSKRESGFAWMKLDRAETTLVEIHLWEGDAQAALDAARKTSCPVRLWLEVAKALEAESPKDAIAVYQAQVEPIVSLTNNDAYDDAAEIVGHVRKLMAKSDRNGTFRNWLDTLRAKHKAKRNFMKRLERFSTAAASKA